MRKGAEPEKKGRKEVTSGILDTLSGVGQEKGAWLVPGNRT
jgi:hypothetical protein